MNEIEKKVREILFGLVRSPDASFLAALRECKGGVWEKLLQETEQHGLTPLLYRRVQAAGVAVPEDVGKKMHAAYLRTAEQNIRRYEILSRIYKACDEAGIEVIPLKGIYLASEVYRDIALREMSDIDILVRKKNLDAVEDILDELGFISLQQNKDPVFEKGHHLRYIIEESGLLIEVHWDLMDPDDSVQVDIDALWDRSGSQDDAGKNVRALSPEDLLLHLSVHLANHTFFLGLRGLYDLAMTIDVFMKVIDWDRLYDLAVAWNAVRALYVNLQLASDLLDVEVMGEYLERIKPGEVDEQYLEVSRELVFASYEPNNPVFSLMSEEDSRQKTEFMLEVLFPSKRTITLKYPSATNRFEIAMSYPLYYMDRIRKYWDVLWGLCLGSRQTVEEKEKHKKILEVKKWLLSG